MSDIRSIDMVLFLDISTVLKYTYSQDLYREFYDDSCLVIDTSKVNFLKSIYDEYPMLKTVFISNWRIRADVNGENTNLCTSLNASTYMPWLNVIGTAPKKMSS